MKTLSCLFGLVVLLVPFVSLRGQESFDAFTERAAADWLRERPQLATSTQYFSGAEQDALDRRLEAVLGRTGLPVDPSLLAACVAQAQKILAQLNSFDRATLKPPSGLRPACSNQVCAA